MKVQSQSSRPPPCFEGSTQSDECVKWRGLGRARPQPARCMCVHTAWPCGSMGVVGHLAEGRRVGTMGLQGVGTGFWVGAGCGLVPSPSPHSLGPGWALRPACTPCPCSVPAWAARRSKSSPSPVWAPLVWCREGPVVGWSGAPSPERGVLHPQPPLLVLSGLPVLLVSGRRPAPVPSCPHPSLPRLSIVPCGLRAVCAAPASSPGCGCLGA
jgi:hypothetical protein